MQVYDEPIEVRSDEVAGAEAPALFLWRNRLWSVRSVLWSLQGGRARRALGSKWQGSWTAHPPEAERAAAPRDDEEEIWRVVAADGCHGTRGVYELTHVLSTGAWRLSRVVD